MMISNLPTINKLFEDIEHGDINGVINALDCHDINCRGSSGHTPLLYAVFKKQVEIALELLNRGADVNARKLKLGGYGTIALHSAAYHNHSVLAQMLLDHGSDIDTQSHVYNNTPLHDALWYKSIDVAKLLVKNGANMFVRNNLDETPRDIAQKNQLYEFLEWHQLFDETNKNVAPTIEEDVSVPEPEPEPERKLFKRNYSEPLPSQEPFCIWLGYLPRETVREDIKEYLTNFKLEAKNIYSGRKLHDRRCAFVEFYNIHDMKVALDNINSIRAPKFKSRDISIDITNRQVSIDLSKRGEKWGKESSRRGRGRGSGTHDNDQHGSMSCKNDEYVNNNKLHENVGKVGRFPLPNPNHSHYIQSAADSTVTHNIRDQIVLKRNYSFPLPRKHPYCIWIGNLPSSTASDEIEQYLAQFKLEVKDICFGKRRGKHTCAYVYFHNVHDMKVALQNIDHDRAPKFKSRVLKIDIADALRNPNIRKRRRRKNRGISKKNEGTRRQKNGGISKENEGTRRQKNEGISPKYRAKKQNLTKANQRSFKKRS